MSETFDKTEYNLTQEPDGTWTMKGIWVIDDFAREECRAQSPKFKVNDETQVYLRFLNYLNRHGTRVSVIVFFDYLPSENGKNSGYPMDLTVRLLNVNEEETQEKTTHVIYSSTALRSYIDFDARWSDLVEGSGFIDPISQKLRIEFNFRHTLRPYELPLQTLSAPPAMAPAPRPMPIDDAKTKFGAVGIMTKDGNECLNAVILLLYSIPYFRKLVYSINTFGYEGTTNRALTLQKLFAALQLSSKAVSSDEFIKYSNWKSEHIAMTHLSEAFATVLSAVSSQIDSNVFNKLFQIQAKKVIRCQDINYESSKDHPFYLLELKLDEKRPQSFSELISNYYSNPERVDEYIVKGKGSHTAYFSNQITSLPYVVLINIQRFMISETGSMIKKIVQDLEIPKNINFDSLISKEVTTDTNSSPLTNYFYSLQSLIVHSGSGDNGRFHANICCDPNSNKWLEYRSYEVSEIDSASAINSTDSICLLYTLTCQNPLLYEPCNADQIPPHVLNPPPMPKEPPYIVTVVTESDYRCATLRGEVGCGLVGKLQFPAQRSKPTSDFVAVISSHLNVPSEKVDDNLLLWQVDSSKGTIIAPIDPKTVISTAVDPQSPIVFLQNSCKTSPSYTATSCGCDYSLKCASDEMIVFIKFYWKKAPFPLQYICSAKVKRNDAVSSIYAIVASRLRIDERVPLVPFLEKDDYSASLIDKSSSFTQAGVKSGDAVILECPIEVPDFCPKFDFGKSLPPVRQIQQFPQYDGRDIFSSSNTDDLIFMDLTLENDEDGNQSFIVPDSVELYYDARHHLAVIGVTTCTSNGPPQSYFRIPLSYPFSLLEKQISYNLGTVPNLDFFEPMDDGEFSNRIIDRNKFKSLKPFLVKLSTVTKKPIILYVREKIESA